MTDPAPEWWFYHLQRTSVERAAPPLMQKCLERGWRVLAVSAEANRRAALDEALWTFDDQSFLPHGQAEAAGLDASRQPVLIADRAENANDAHALFLLDGFDHPPAADFERCMVMFDDGDAESRATARAQFKAAKDADLVTRYFQQTNGGGWKEAGV